MWLLVLLFLFSGSDQPELQPVDSGIVLYVKGSVLNKLSGKDSTDVKKDFCCPPGLRSQPVKTHL